jgi:hypothetical protein
MSKRSTRIAKRDEFEKALREVEENLRSRRGNKSGAITSETTGQDGESGSVEIHNPGKEDSSSSNCKPLDGQE